MSYPDWFDRIVRCPETGETLSRRPECYIRSDGLQYPIINGIVSIAYPRSPGGQDASLNRFYNVIAPFYDWSERFFGRLITGLDVVTGREEIVSRLPITRGMRLLEVSPGPGVFQKLLRARLTDEGALVALDLSLNMLRQCQVRSAGQNVHLVHGNAQSLPFADNSFDGLFHFGGVNLFNVPGKAIREFIRVVRRDGLVSWGDEGFSRNYPYGNRRKILARINPGFLKPIPVIPESLHRTEVHEVYGGLGYLVVAYKT